MRAHALWSTVRSILPLPASFFALPKRFLASSTFDAYLPPVVEDFAFEGWHQQSSCTLRHEPIYMRKQEKKNVLIVRIFCTLHHQRLLHRKKKECHCERFFMQNNNNNKGWAYSIRYIYIYIAHIRTQHIDTGVASTKTACCRCFSFLTLSFLFASRGPTDHPVCRHRILVRTP